jgi:hypothetical protein
MNADSGVCTPARSSWHARACLGLDDHQWSDEWLVLGDKSGAASPVGPGRDLVSQGSLDSAQTNSGMISLWLPPAHPAPSNLYSSEHQQQSSGQLGLEPSPSDVDDLVTALVDPDCYSLDELEQDCPLIKWAEMLREAGVPVTAGPDACSPTAGLITAPELAAVGAPSRPVVPGDSGCQPGEALCSSCAGLKPQGDQLTERLAGSRTLADKQLASELGD